MLNFAVGPVQSDAAICSIGAEQVPYFRTAEFSSVVLESERLMKKFCRAGEDARALFITGSGTASMEAAVMNLFSRQDRVLTVNGGSFGHRFVEICGIHHIPCTEIKMERGKNITEEQLAAYAGGGYTGFLINMHETSTCVLYDMDVVSRFCRENGLFLVVDAVSSFLADPIDMEKWGIGAMLTGSQKALACPPGMSILVLSPEGVERVEKNSVESLYFDLKRALKDGERGQTPFTPAVGILRQIHARLRAIDEAGLDAEYRRIAGIAADFRSRLTGLPLEIPSESLSMAATPLHTLHGSAYEVFLTLKDHYGIWVCPNGGELADYMFRVGHMGNLTREDNSALLDALWDMNRKGIL